MFQSNNSRPVFMLLTTLALALLASIFSQPRVQASGGQRTPMLPASEVNELTIHGPSLGVTGANYTFTATVAQLTATLPITFEWEVTGHAPLTHVVNDNTDSATFAWEDAGIKAISVRVADATGTARKVSATHLMRVEPGALAELSPDTATTLLAFEDDLTTVVEVPSGAVSEPATLLYRFWSHIPGNGDLQFGGRAFELIVYRDGVTVSDFEFLQPVTITVPYGQENVSNMDETGLKLYTLQAGAWLDAATSCTPAVAQTIDLDKNSVTVDVCGIGPFALFGPQVELATFIPVIWR